MSNANKATDVFTDARERASAESFKAGASEILQIMPLVRDFVLTIVRPTGLLDRECKSLLSLFAVVDAMLEAKHSSGKGGSPEPLQRMIAALEAHKAAYGTALLKPKHHYAMHNCMQAAHSGVLVLDCFVHERKHQMLKQCATTIRNTVSFEASVLARVVLEQARQLRSVPDDCSLVGATVEDGRVADALQVARAMLAKSLRFGATVFTVGDMVLLGGDKAGLIRACVQAQGALLLVLSVFSRRKHGECYSDWEPLQAGSPEGPLLARQVVKET